MGVTTLDAPTRLAGDAHAASPGRRPQVPEDAFWFELEAAPAHQDLPVDDCPGTPITPPVAVRFSPVMPQAIVERRAFVVTRRGRAPAAGPIEPPAQIEAAEPLEPPAWIREVPELDAPALDVPTLDIPELDVSEPDVPEPAPLAAMASAVQAKPVLPEPEPVRHWGWEEVWGFEVSQVQRRPGRRRTTGRERSPRSKSKRLRRPATVVCTLVAGAGVAAFAALSAAGPPGAIRPAAARSTIVPAPSSFALRTIPARYLRMYVRAGIEYGLDWTKLAAVGQIESRSGQSRLPGVSGGTNYAGAEGPAQFLPRTWARFGVAADGSGRLNPYNPANAITAMAAYLKASGAPEDWRAALFAYNHSTTYVNEVLALGAHLQAGR